MPKPPKVRVTPFRVGHRKLWEITLGGKFVSSHTDKIDAQYRAKRLRAEGA